MPEPTLGTTIGNYDIYVVFVERGLSLLNKTGQLGSVVDQIVDFGHSQVFSDATTYTCLLFLNQTHPKKIQLLRVQPNHLQGALVELELIPAASLGSDSWLFLNTQGQDLFKKLQAVSVCF